MLLSAALALPALAADPDARLHELTVLAEQDNAKARTLLVQEGPALIAGAPYALRIDYLRLLRRVQADAGDLRAAYATNEQIVTLAQAEGDAANLALAGLGRVQRHLDNGDPARALALLETLGPRYRDLNNLEFKAGLDLLYGLAYGAVGQYDRALQSQLQALDLVQRHRGLSSPREADIRLHLARLHVDSGHPDKALEMLRQIHDATQGNVQGARAARKALPPRIAASVAFAQGRAMVAQDDIIGALGAFERALELARANALAGIEAQVQASSADAYLRLGRHAQAEQAARAALSLAATSDDQLDLQMAEASLGLALFDQGREREGLAHIDAAEARLRESGAVASVARLLADKGAALERAGRYRDALGVVRQRETLVDQLALSERQKTMSALQEQFKARERATQLDHERHEAAARDAESDNHRLRLLVAALGAVLMLLACAVAFALYKKSLRTGRRVGELNAELAWRSARDPLTGLFNRRSFQDRMRSRTGEAAARADAADCFTLLDIDHFKRINDEYGHAAGDAVLVEVGRRLRQATRESDMVLRWGGEEFLVYSQGVSLPQRPVLVRRMLDAISATPVLLDDGTALQVNATAGAVSLPFEHEQDGKVDWEQAIALADRALYRGKETGRNRGYLVAGLRHPDDGPQEGLQLDLILPGVPA